jgi:hypothetical protein
MTKEEAKAIFEDYQKNLQKTAEKEEIAIADFFSAKKTLENLLLLEKTEEGRRDFRISISACFSHAKMKEESLDRMIKKIEAISIILDQIS